MAKIKMSEIKTLIREMLDEMGVDEMARTANTGGAFTITPEGENILKQTVQAGSVPAGVSVSEILVLKWLYQAKKAGKRVQKADYAKEVGKVQPQVNPIFNALEQKGFASKEAYQSLGGGTAAASSKPGFDVKSALGDLDL